MNDLYHKRLNSKRFKRALAIFSIVGCTSAGMFFLINANSDALVFFKTPTELINARVEQSAQQIRIGGQVKQGSVSFDNSGVYVFYVTDGTHEMKVIFDGTLPDLFREGQGVVAEGMIGSDKTFIAKRVLAKHDENYKPPQNSNLD